MQYAVWVLTSFELREQSDTEMFGGAFVVDSVVYAPRTQDKYPFHLDLSQLSQETMRILFSLRDLPPSTSAHSPVRRAQKGPTLFVAQEREFSLSSSR